MTTTSAKNLSYSHLTQNNNLNNNLNNNRQFHLQTIT
jgi:hypothetical protein